MSKMIPDSKEEHSAHVLLVDDEQDFLDLLSERLGARGMMVTTANCGKEVLKLISGKEFDIVVLDLSMPGMDGLETMKRIKQLRPNIETIMLTGHASLQSGIEAMKCGAGDYLEKPADMKKLLKRIDDAQNKRLAELVKKSAKEVKQILKRKGW